MAYIACSKCWTQTWACCGSWTKCKDCKAAIAQETREQLEKDALERQAKYDSGEIKPVNIADSNPVFCRCCWIPKTWCQCECKWK